MSFQEELQKQERSQQLPISLEAMRNSLLALHPSDSEIGQEIEHLYQEACDGKIEGLVELYEKQREQLDRYAENELTFLVNILSAMSAHWGEYFNQQGSFFQEYQEFMGPLFEGCQGRFGELVDLHAALVALGVSGESNIFLKQKVQVIIEKIGAFRDSTEEEKQDAQVFFTDVRLQLQEVASDINEQRSAGKTDEEEEALDYYDTDDIADDELDSGVQQQTKSTSNAQTLTPAEEKKDGGVDIQETQKNSPHEVADIMIRVTEDEEQVSLWRKMITYGFFRGLIREAEPGVFVLSLTDQVLPWCGLPPEEFFQKNKRYHDLFPQALAEIVNPRTGEYFPEALFLDDSGYALRYFLQDRWDEYLRTPQYRIYHYQFVDQQVPFAA